MYINFPASLMHLVQFHRILTFALQSDISNKNISTIFRCHSHLNYRSQYWTNTTSSIFLLFFCCV